jgi:hypothetical protein
MIHTVNLSPQAKYVIDCIWKNKKNLPRAQMFICMLMTKKNIASAKRVNKRISKISSLCSRCEAAENDEHLFCHCSFSRVVWFASPLTIKTDHLHGSCAHILYFIFSMLNFSEDVDLACYILWFISKARNYFRFQNKHARFRSFCQSKAAQKAQYEAYIIEEHLHTNINLFQTLPRQENSVSIPSSICKTDASFIVVIRPALEFFFQYHCSPVLLVPA